MTAVSTERGEIAIRFSLPTARQFTAALTDASDPLLVAVRDMVAVAIHASDAAIDAVEFDHDAAVKEANEA